MFAIQTKNLKIMRSQSNKKKLSLKKINVVRLTKLQSYQIKGASGMCGTGTSVGTASNC